MRFLVLLLVGCVNPITHGGAFVETEVHDVCVRMGIGKFPPKGHGVILKFEKTFNGSCYEPKEK